MQENPRLKSFQSFLDFALYYYVSWIPRYSGRTGTQLRSGRPTIGGSRTALSTTRQNSSRLFKHLFQPTIQTHVEVVVTLADRRLPTRGVARLYMAI